MTDKALFHQFQLSDWGYPFLVDEHGNPYRRSLQQGPEYMWLMRKQIKQDLRFHHEKTNENRVPEA